MPPIHSRRLLVSLLACAPILAACSTPQLPSLSSVETTEVLNSAQADGTATVEAFTGGEAMSAVAAVGGLPGGSVPLPMGTMTFSALGGDPELLADYDLDRTVYEYNGTEFVPQGPSANGNLEFHWTYGDSATPASFVIDWDAPTPTIDAVDPYSPTYTVEVPVDMTATLSSGTGASQVELGKMTSSYEYYDCSGVGHTTETVDADTSGYLGVDGEKLEFSIRQSFTEGNVDTLSLTGEVDLVSSEGTAGANWNVSLSGDAERVDCVVETFMLSSGNISAGAYVNDNEAQLTLRLDNFQYEENDFGHAEVTAVDIDGSVRLNGAVAFTASGTFGEDGDGDGVYLDGVVLTFAEGETVSLEKLFEDEFATPAAIMGALLSLR